MEKHFETFDLTHGIRLRLFLTLDLMDESEARWNVDFWELAADNFKGLLKLAKGDRGSLRKVIEIIGDLCEDQLTKENVTPGEFAELMIGGGDDDSPILDACLALTKASLRFFPQGKMRELKASQLDAARSASDAFCDLAVQKLTSTDFAAELRRLPRTPSAGTAGRSPDELDSPTDPEVSAIDSLSQWIEPARPRTGITPRN